MYSFSASAESNARSSATLLTKAVKSLPTQPTSSKKSATRHPIAVEILSSVDVVGLVLITLESVPLLTGGFIRLPTSSWYKIPLFYYSFDVHTYFAIISTTKIIIVAHIL